MIGLLLITHERLGTAYRCLAAHVFPERNFDHVRILNVDATAGHDEIIAQAQALLPELDCGNGVLILTDIFGATPCNAAMKLVKKEHSAMITGLNASMLIKAAANSAQADNLSEFSESVREAGIRGIMVFSGQEY